VRKVGRANGILGRQPRGWLYAHYGLGVTLRAGLEANQTGPPQRSIPNVLQAFRRLPSGTVRPKRNRDASWRLIAKRQFSSIFCLHRLFEASLPALERRSTREDLRGTRKAHHAGISAAKT